MKDAAAQRSYHKRYYAANRQAIDAKNVAWARTNPQRARAITLVHRAKHPEKFCATQMAARARKRAAAKGVPFCDVTCNALAISRMLVAKPYCECCKVRFDFGAAFGRADRSGPRPSAPTLDRIYPLDGYVKHNIALLCFRCNRLKSDATPSELETISAWMRTVTL